MKTKQTQVTLYPTPAPEMTDVLAETNLLVAIEKACEYLYAPEGSLDGNQREKIQSHFKQLFQWMDGSYHLELLLEPGEFDWQAFWQAIQQFFPQFAWLKGQTEEPKYGRQVYRFDFVPLTLRKEGFPFAVHLEESLSQQFALAPEEALKRAEQLFQELAAQQLEKELEQSTTTTAVDSIETSSIDRVQKEEENLESQSKARLRAVNQKLELVIEKLELSMLYSGIQYFKQEQKEESNWDKPLKISLREYTYLLQKARFLEQMWHLNGELVNKTEKMTVTANQLVYERDQVKQIKANFSARDIHFVIYECQVIESRAQVHARPWFRKPYVKLMKMDYDNLLGKAAYFDLLQGESSILEKMVREHQDPPVKDAEEAG
ncbi:hypothetical protein [Enterococcus pallens]|uniref:Uncharacterized protein n=1 Tax=Enterococcus pallens ATCC BAA-351 TaxID=1158607 RepID=R2SR43_9ENTE|nr:hypothetical protein [Enterococcus pallens]EOH97730.1 hypothetical protein UAU_00398 [Enterococcus pallens ATCC BAA-351]EOU20851.1 hypothetical protein I588_01698 [Enterococcus pallens ATCC BAA-351]